MKDNFTLKFKLNYEFKSINVITSRTSLLAVTSSLEKDFNAKTLFWIFQFARWNDSYW